MGKVGISIKDKRLKFKIGLQKIFLIKIKEKSCLSWTKLAKRLNVCTHTLMFDWRNERSTLPQGIAKKLLDEYPFEKWETIESKWITGVLDEDWRQKSLADNIKKRIEIPPRSEELAEIFGIVLGDGHLDRKVLTIAGNSNELMHYIYLNQKIKMLFGLDSKIIKIKNQNSMQLRVNSTELIKFLIANNFVLGDKIKNKESLPDWIFEKKEFIYGALRGLFDTDGGIYQKQKRYKRAIIEFQTESPHIRKNLFELIEKAGFKPSKSDVNVRIQNQAEVLRFFQLIGSANPKNIIRYTYFIKTGEIPLKEKLKKEIISFKVEKSFKAPVV